MQISSISFNQVFRGSNAQEIKRLQQKREAIKWGSEGCTGDLSKEDAYELEVRKEIAVLEEKEQQTRYSLSGFNGSLKQEDAARLATLRSVISAIEAKKAQQPQQAILVESIYDIPSANTYGVPDSTFWGDWAR